MASRAITVSMTKSEEKKQIFRIFLTKQVCPQELALNLANYTKYSSVFPVLAYQVF